MSSASDGARYVDGLEEPAALIVVTDPERSATVSPKKAAALHGLTHSEAQLAAALASGHSIREYAATAEISEHTARWHLKQVFSKTGTKRQTQLVRLLLTELAP